MRGDRGREGRQTDGVLGPHLVLPAYQMLSLSATATQGVNGWNLTTEGTPGFLLRKIWSSSLVMPVGTHVCQGG